MDIIKYNQIRQQLVSCENIEEIKDIRDKTVALRSYAKQCKESLEKQNEIAEIKLRAERRCGQLLEKMDKSKGNADRGKDRGKKTLEEIGVNRNQSSNWQKLARMSNEDFEKWLEEKKTAGEEITLSSILRDYIEVSNKESEDFGVDFEIPEYDEDRDSRISLVNYVDTGLSSKTFVFNKSDLIEILEILKGRTPEEQGKLIYSTLKEFKKHDNN